MNHIVSDLFLLLHRDFSPTWTPGRKQRHLGNAPLSGSGPCSAYSSLSSPSAPVADCLCLWPGHIVGQAADTAHAVLSGGVVGIQNGPRHHLGPVLLHRHCRCLTPPPPHIGFQSAADAAAPSPVPLSQNPSSESTESSTMIGIVDLLVKRQCLKTVLLSLRCGHVPLVSDPQRLLGFVSRCSC